MVGAVTAASYKFDQSQRRLKSGNVEASLELCRLLLMAKLEQISSVGECSASLRRCVKGGLTTRRLAGASM